MSTSRHFNFIALLAAALSLVITVLFMNGEALGLSRVIPEEENALFTQADLEDDWMTSGTAKITLTGDDALIEGDGAYVQDGNVVIYAGGDYILEGSLENGSVIVNETSKTKGTVRILLNGVSIYCEDSAAFDIEEATRVILTLAEDTENVIESGAEFSEEAQDANIRGALFSRDDLSINGSGSLNVISGYRHGIVCNDDLRITGGTIRVEAAEDGIHVNESARFTGMTLTINAIDDGITVSNDDNEGELLVESGTILIESCREGLESEKVTIDGGEISISFTDDGINAGGADPELVINGGTITLVSMDGRDVDGLDSNNDIVINGGMILVSVNAENMNNAIDFGSETGGSCYINGGTLIAAGSGGMAEEPSTDSAQPFIMYRFETTYAAEETVRLADTSGNVILEAQMPASFNELTLSDPSLAEGCTYVLTVGEDSFEIEMTGTAVSLGTSGGGMGGFGRPFGREAFAEGVAENSEGQFPDELPEGEEGMRHPGPWEESVNAEGTAGAGVPPMQFGPPADGGPDEAGQTPNAEGMMQGGRGQGGGRPGEFMNGPGGMPQEASGMSAADMKTALMITGASLTVLLVGIFIMAGARNRRNIA